MNLERRTFLVVFVTLVVATGMAFAVAQAVVFQSVKDLEQKRAEDSVHRAVQALQHEVDGLDRTGADWAHRDDVYRFVQGNDAGFAKGNLVPMTFRSQRINVMLFFDKDDNLVSQTGFDLQNNSFRPVPLGLLAPENLRPLLSHPDLNRSVSGIAMAAGQPILVASWAILAGNLDSPAAGTVILGRDLDAAQVQQLQSSTVLALTVRPWLEVKGDPRIAALGNANDVLVEPRSSSVIFATSRLDDVTGQAVLAMEVQMDRPIYEQSVQNLAFGLASTILVGGGILVLITLLLDRSVFTPLHRLTRDVEALGTGTVGGRVAALRDDEIGQLAASFNRLMGRLDRDRVDLQRSNQDLRDFAAVVSHDLQPPLSTIALNAAVVRERERTRLGPDALQRLDRLETTALRMAEHIRSILDYSRVSSQDAPMAEVNFNDILEDVVNDLEERMHATGGRIEYRSMPRLQANRTQLTQLMLNLMGNALKYHRPGTPPVVKVHAEPYADGKGWQGWRVVVEDNGIGFDPADLDKMVRPYTRLEHRVEGYGLGLATCHKIIERHHGRLSAHSVPGEGSTFMVDLPVTQPAEVDGQPPAAPS